MSDQTVVVNRAPVLTLWAAVVAERLGYDRDAALTLGRAVAGLNAQAKGRAIGVFQVPKPTGGEPPRKTGLGEEFWAQVCGRLVPARNTPEGVRAVVKDKPIDPAKVHEYLERSFGESLSAARQAMRELAESFPSEALEAVSYQLYESFRPKIAPSKRGWGQKGNLDLRLIRSLTGKRPEAG